MFANSLKRERERERERGKNTRAPSSWRWLVVVASAANDYSKGRRFLVATREKNIEKRARVFRGEQSIRRLLSVRFDYERFRETVSRRTVEKNRSARTRAQPRTPVKPLGDCFFLLARDRVRIEGSACRPCRKVGIFRNYRRRKRSTETRSCSAPLFTARWKPFERTEQATDRRDSYRIARIGISLDRSLVALNFGDSSRR